MNLSLLIGSLASITRNDNPQAPSACVLPGAEFLGGTKPRLLALKHRAFAVCSTEVCWSETTDPFEGPCAEIFVPFGLEGAFLTEEVSIFCDLSL